MSRIERKNDRVVIPLPTSIPINSTIQYTVSPREPQFIRLNLSTTSTCFQFSSSTFELLVQKDRLNATTCFGILQALAASVPILLSTTCFKCVSLEFFNPTNSSHLLPLNFITMINNLLDLTAQISHMRASLTTRKQFPNHNHISQADFQRLENLTSDVSYLQTLSNANVGYLSEVNCRNVVATSLLASVTEQSLKPVQTFPSWERPGPQQLKFLNAAKTFCLSNEIGKGVYFARYKLNEKIDQIPIDWTDVEQRIKDLQRNFQQIRTGVADFTQDDTVEHVFVNFANKHIGNPGGTNSGFCLQEEIIFLEHPALFAIMCLFSHKPLESDEVFCCSRPTRYFEPAKEGLYGSTYMYKEYKKQQVDAVILSMDALEEGKKDNYRNLVKIYSGFKHAIEFTRLIRQTDKPIRIHTGNFGLGGFSDYNSQFGSFVGQALAQSMLMTNSPNLRLELYYYPFEQRFIDCFKRTITLDESLKKSKTLDVKRYNQFDKICEMGK